jgi:acylphosphatase
MIKSFSITVRGKVQGVFFRASAKEKADELDLKGFAKNEMDGSVYLEVQGDEDNLEDFIHWCQRGPTYARVEACDVTEIEYREGLKNFEIKRG